MFEQYSGRNMCNVFKRFIEALLCDSWRLTYIGGSLDGVRSMAGPVTGLVNRSEQACVGAIVRVWCRLIKLDFVMQLDYKHALKRDFYSQLNTLIGHLRRQQNLIAEMRSTCLKVSDVCWISMYSRAKWLVSNRVHVQLHLNDKRPDCSSKPMWWTFLRFVCAFLRSPRRQELCSFAARTDDVGVEATATIERIEWRLSPHVWNARPARCSSDCWHWWMSWII